MIISYWMHSSIFSQCRDLSTGLICSVLGLQLLREQGFFAVAGDAIFVFVVNLGKVSYNCLI